MRPGSTGFVQINVHFGACGGGATRGPRQGGALHSRGCVSALTSPRVCQTWRAKASNHQPSFFSHSANRQGKKSDKFSNVSVMLWQTCWVQLHTDAPWTSHGVTDRCHQCLSTLCGIGEGYWGLGKPRFSSCGPGPLSSPSLARCGKQAIAELSWTESCIGSGTCGAFGLRLFPHNTLRSLAVVWDGNLDAFFFFFKGSEIVKANVKTSVVRGDSPPSSSSGVCPWVSLVQCVILKHHALGIQN